MPDRSKHSTEGECGRGHGANEVVGEADSDMVAAVIDADPVSDKTATGVRAAARPTDAFGGGTVLEAKDHEPNVDLFALSRPETYESGQEYVLR